MKETKTLNICWHKPERERAVRSVVDVDVGIWVWFLGSWVFFLPFSICVNLIFCFIVSLFIRLVLVSFTSWVASLLIASTCVSSACAPTPCVLSAFSWRPSVHSQTDYLEIETPECSGPQTPQQSITPQRKCSPKALQSSQVQILASFAVRCSLLSLRLSNKGHLCQKHHGYKQTCSYSFSVLSVAFLGG